MESWQFILHYDCEYVTVCVWHRIRRNGGAFDNYCCYLSFVLSTYILLLCVYFIVSHSLRLSYSDVEMYAFRFNYATTNMANFLGMQTLGAKQAERIRREWKRREWKPSTQLHLWIATRACPELCIWNVIWCSQIYCAKSKDFQFDDSLEWQCVCLNVCDTHAWLFSLVVMFPLLH